MSMAKFTCLINGSVVALGLMDNSSVNFWINFWQYSEVVKFWQKIKKTLSRN